MTTVTISLNSIDKVKTFCEIVARFDCDLDLVSGRYIIDAKSIMGIFSLDISKPLLLRVEDLDEQDAFDKVIAEYAI